jgi:hypothetical protein
MDTKRRMQDYYYRYSLSITQSDRPNEYDIVWSALQKVTFPGNNSDLQFICDEFNEKYTTDTIQRYNTRNDEDFADNVLNH